jgi:hypothetical protein
MPKPDKDWAKRQLRGKKQDGKSSRADEHVVKQIQAEAKKNGATLEKEGGRGGLKPSLMLALLRKYKWRCDVDGCKTPKERLTADHISGHAKEIEQDPKARKNPELRKGIELGHVNEIDALHIVCAMHHDREHDRERKIEHGKKPEPMV